MRAEQGGGSDQREDGDVAEDEEGEEAHVVVDELVEGGRALLARDELPPGLGLGVGAGARVWGWDGAGVEVRQHPGSACGAGEVAAWARGYSRRGT